MSIVSVQDLSHEQVRQIQQALAEAFPNGPATTFALERAKSKRGSLHIPVKPSEYPTEMFEFYQGLAAAEIELRDAGLMVWLTPDIRQKMIVVGTPRGHSPIPFVSTDGAEYSDLAQILGKSVEELGTAEITGYAYDNEDDFRAALSEAKMDNPSVDFSDLKYV